MSLTSSQKLPEFVPPALARVALRLQFPPSYVVVGVYRLFTDKSLYVPAWDKCRHGAKRGLIVGMIWTILTYGVQRRIVRALLNNPSSFFSFGYLTKLSKTANDNETILGLPLPFGLSTYVTVLLVGAQVTWILNFFLSRNIRIARQRAWDQTVASRGKGPEFWQPYVEEWEVPPVVNEGARGRVQKMFKMWIVRFIVHKFVLLPLSFYPLLGTFITAWLKAMGTAEYLHKPYFEAKKMNKHQVAVYMEERKWDYWFFGFAVSLLEGLPVVGLVFTVSNRIGAAMWAHDLEKRQHYVATQKSGSIKDKGEDVLDTLSKVD